MKKIVVLVIIPLLLAGCSSNSISIDEYNKVVKSRDEYKQKYEDSLVESSNSSNTDSSNIFEHPEDTPISKDSLSYSDDEISAAIEDAKKWLDYDGNSYYMLLARLISDNYAEDLARYAINKCNVDWESEAVELAQKWIDYDGNSYRGLIARLINDNLEIELAKYGADNCAVSWEDEAVEAAQKWIDYDGNSYNILIKRMYNDGFESELAKYGAENCTVDWNAEALEYIEQVLPYMSDTSDEAIVERLKKEGFEETHITYAIENK